jgi:hypothetical protein
VTVDDFTNTVEETVDIGSDGSLSDLTFNTAIVYNGNTVNIYDGNLIITDPYVDNIIRVRDGTVSGVSNQFTVVGDNIHVSPYTGAGAAEAPGIAIPGERITMFDFDILNIDPANTVDISNIEIFVESSQSTGAVVARPASLISSMQIYDISAGPGAEVFIDENASPNNTLAAVNVPVPINLNAYTTGTLIAGDMVRLRVYVTIRNDISGAAIPNIQLRIGDIIGTFVPAGTFVIPTNTNGDSILDPAFYIRSDLTNLKSGAAEAAFNYPNPFNPRKESTTITFFNGGTKATVKIYSITGELVRNLSKQTPQQSGSVEVQWDGKNGRGRIVRNGVYVAVIKADGKRIMVKIAVVK